MPIDVELFRSLTDKEQENLKNKLETALEAIQQDLYMVEKKLKEAMMDSNTKHADLQPMLSYRNELKQVSDQIRYDLDMVNRYLNKDHANRRFNINPIKILGGTVNIRGNDSNNSPVKNAKTYAEILAERQNNEEDKFLKDLDQKLKNIEDSRKADQARKQSQTQTQPQTQSPKTQNA